MRRLAAATPSRSRQGSVFILVVAILAVLILMTMTLSYISKVDLMASRNWANTVQSRMAAVTGVPSASFALSSSPIKQAALSNHSEVSGTKATELKPIVLRMDLGRKAAATISATKAADGSSRKTQTVRSDADRAPTYLDSADALATALFEDESAKININAVVPVSEPQQTAQAQKQSSTDSGKLQVEVKAGFLSEDALARFISTALDSQGVANANAPQIAHAIALQRWGTDGQPGVSQIDQEKTQTVERSYGQISSRRTLDTTDQPLDKPHQASSDPRRPALGDDHLYTSVDEIMSVPGMSPQAFRVLAPYLTTFSVSFAAFELPKSTNPAKLATLSTPGIATDTDEQTFGFPQIDPNTASPEEIYAVLHCRFPNAPEALLGQFVANLIDRRDTDNIPTTVKLGTGTYYGQEVIPYINEVCPDPTYSDNTDGQFIELFNPYQHAMDLNGWSLRGAGGSVDLAGSIPSDGYLVLTNDYNNDNDDKQKSTEEDMGSEGSFYNLFHVVPTGAQRQLKECPQMKLGRESGLVQLVNKDGRVVDEFNYQRGSVIGMYKSYQRGDPRLRIGERDKATPLAPNFDVKFDTDTARALEIQEQWQNKPFLSPLDVMLVSSAYTTQPETGQASDTGQTSTDQAFAMPQLLASGDTALDVRLVDCFRIGAVIPPINEELEDEPIQTTFQKDSAGVQAMYASVGQTNPPSPRCDVAYGLLNLNTAPLATLSALPGMKKELLASLERSRRASPGSSGNAQASASELSPRDRVWWMPLDPFATPHWNNLSDFLKDEEIWAGRPLYDRLDAVYPFSQLVATRSMALRVVTANRVPDPAASGKPERRPTLIRAERLLSGDRGAIETVNFGFLNLYSDTVADPDLRFASRTGSASTSDSLRQGQTITTMRTTSRKAN